MIITFVVAVASRGLFDIKWHSEGPVPCRRQAMVHKRMSKQIWVARVNQLGPLYHLLLPWDGYCSMDCELRDISVKVSWGLWRNSCYCKLDLQPHCCPVLPFFDTSYWDIMDISDIRRNISSGLVLCDNICTRNQRASN